MSRTFADPVRILALAQAGHTAHEAAQHTGLALYTVREAARQMGVKFRDPRTPDADQLERMADMRQDGATYAQIADAHGMTVSGARKVLLRRASRTDLMARVTEQSMDVA